MKSGAAAFRDDLDRHWLQLTLVVWLFACIWSVWSHWAQIYWLGLGDTDDNMRLMQVRAWLGGQGWFDLRQYRLNPPAGFDIHWSRIVDLPLAALIVVLRPFAGTEMAEKLACGIAPLLPLSIAMAGLAATARRLVAPLAWPLALVLLMGCTATLLMFSPDRVDHHGWQLAMLSVTVAGLCDPKGPRGGLLVGVASAVSLAIGLEMLPYCAMAGAIVALRWVWTHEEAPRLQAYALSLGGGTALGFAVFASYANRAARCDALTPVWLSVTVVAGALLFLCARWSPQSRAARLGAAAAAGAVVAGGFALVFPQCLGRPEQVSPELVKSWLSNVREAKPIYKHPFRNAFPIAVLPVIGVIGAILATWRARRSPAISGWLPVMLFVTFAALMLLWQARAGPAAQLLAVPGATALAWIVLPILLANRSVFVRVFGTVGAFLLLSGLFSAFAIRWLKVDPPSPRMQQINRAGGKCTSLPRLQQLDRFAATTMFTFVDLGPRLIVATHHSAVAGPYHRNGDAILDVQHAFSRTPAEARGIMKAHGATMLLVCPNMSESTVYRARNPGGFYDQLASNARFDWLTPVPLPRGAPFRLFRIR
ncbi:AcrB/AcrD/AcrF family protein [Sphingomonas aracearum]|uniref:AcrB/AcrD/AcrF family protein n=1 Tax=Sphingomonas aracearum TaxID=2283317 RepID=A0A369VSU6_9SPHN|nr:AcrB/AcrD/AcrF family protein [Sphingomonas aracearum]RDE04745.1 AcrB/AcrD/AcrF family protein [Sphingomonas aracearum]